MHTRFITGGGGRISAQSAVRVSIRISIRVRARVRVRACECARVRVRVRVRVRARVRVHAHGCLPRRNPSPEPRLPPMYATAVAVARCSGLNHIALSMEQDLSTHTARRIARSRVDVRRRHTTKERNGKKERNTFTRISDEWTRQSFGIACGSGGGRSP